MLRARKLAVFLLFVPVAAAQEPAAAPAEVKGVSVSAQAGTEIRIELSVSGSGSEAKVTATYHDSMIMDVTGALYHGLPRRIPVNAAGVRAVRLWMQSEIPPLTRIVVEIDRPEQYLVSTDGNAIVLRVGPALAGAAGSRPSNTSEVTGGTSPTPAGRGSASASAVRALEGIFHHKRSNPTVYGHPKIWGSQPASSSSAASETAQSPSSTQNDSVQNTPPATATASPPTQSVEQTPAKSVAANTERPFDTSSSSTAVANPKGDAQVPSPIENQNAQSPDLVVGSLPVTANLPVTLPVVIPRATTETNVTLAPEVPATGAPSSSSAVEVAATNASNAPTASAPTVAPPSPAETATTVPDALAKDVTENAAPSGETSASSPDRAVIIPVANPGMRTEFHVKFVDQNTAYLDGGRSSGLAEGMKLFVKNKGAIAGADKTATIDDAVAELVVVGVAETSAVTEIHTPKRPVVVGDVAYLSSADLQALVQQDALGATRKYPAVITFSEGGDALDEEARAEVPRPPLPSVNRANLRFGFDYSGTKSQDSSQLSSSSLGALIQADWTRIGGTYWNLRGYWRGRLTSTSAASQQTLQDLINRTYHLSLTYENPNSRWLLGVGRLFLPWASSLNTLDGGYFGAKLGHGFTTGIFGGSTPDPTSWSYSPNRHIGGAFLNEQGGSFDAIHYSSTAGFGKSFATVTYTTTTATGTTQASYQDNRPFVFFENSISYKRTFSIYSAVQADKPSANPAVPSPGAGISQSFLTVRFQPFKRIEFNANETYFRDIPTFDPQLVGTGLLDQYLFQGFSGGVRVEAVKNVILYTDLGRSSRSGDVKSSLNEMYGITFLKIPKLNFHLDAHYSRFNSSFGSGTYRAFSLSRDVGEGFHLELLAGDQVFTSSLAGNQNAKFITTNVSTSLGSMFFMQGGFTAYRGQLQNYNQWNIILGYRFNNKWKHK
ncbi:MAG: hypothetical protein WCE61_12155 [Candidatus Acidiferrum sp.]